MIRFLKGTVHSTQDRTLILLVNGVGYEVYAPSAILAENDEELELFIHSHIREDAFTLYGFRTQRELEFFEMLLGINGVGPKMAITLLDLPIETIQHAVLSKDVATLTQTPGVGKKIAERIILELKNKVDQLPEGSSPRTHQSIHPDVFDALESLGYKRSHIQKVLMDVEAEHHTVEDWVRSFLQRA